ncbi:MAG: prolyl oligopeptidase family serine peptidase [Firmicutes bacterium]|nr:prolyl oligopeptidase family serine peptidase [Bacillota bacterium]
MSDVLEVNGIPVLASKADLETGHPVVIVIHGMSTTAETLRTGWPDHQRDGLTRVYWRLPVLRQERDTVIARQKEDVFRSLFWPVVHEARQELTQLIASLGRTKVGLFGFSIGGLISLWGALDNPQVAASVAVGGVPYLDYLLNYFPDYDWEAPDVKACREAIDLRSYVSTLAQKPTLVLHGLADEQAKWEWMKHFSDALLLHPQSRHDRRLYDHVQHRLTGASDVREEADLANLRETATNFFIQHLSE